MSLSEQLVSYILSAMMSWVPLGNQYERAPDGKWLHNEKGYYVQEDQTAALARYKVSAEAMVRVALDPSNIPLFKVRGTPDTIEGRVKTALQLASIASFEGGFHKWVEDGDCNTPEFHKNHPHECDGGAAFTNWQIHLYRYLIKDGELVQSQYLEQSGKQEDRDYVKVHKDGIITGPQLIADPHLAAQVAYYLVRYSTRNFSSLCSYTGEDCLGTHPLATLRSGRAVDYYRKHPFVYVEDTIDLPLPSSPPDLLKPVWEMLVGVATPMHMPELRQRLFLD